MKKFKVKKLYAVLLSVLGIGYGVQYCLVSFVFNGYIPLNYMNMVYAQGQDINYSYDSLGRVKSVVYPDGTKITYIYDANGNLLSSIKTTGNSQGGEENNPVVPNPPDTEVTSEENTASDTEENKPEEDNVSDTEENKPEEDDVSDTNENKPEEDNVSDTNENKPEENNVSDTQKNNLTEKQKVSDSVHYSFTDINKYNQFKKKKGRIKSLKVVKKKSTYSLKIVVNKVNSRGRYGEIGYQVKYATNSKYKRSKTVSFNRSKKGSLSSKTWKVKKGKTYYIKVRAYMKTATGKTIYTKYSTTKKIKVKK